MNEEDKLKKQDYVLNDGFLPMYCVLAHRQLFKTVGPLAEYPYAGTEAEEYAYRIDELIKKLKQV